MSNAPSATESSGAATSSDASCGRRASERLVRLIASEIGAALDSDLIRGGGTDDTAVLQTALNRAADGTPVHLTIDGVALVSGLDVYGNTTIEGVNGAGLFLKDGSNRAIIRNANRSREAISDEHIVVKGCFLNGNRFNQEGADPPSQLIKRMNQEPDGTYISGLQFLGVKYLTIRDVTLWSIRSFGALIGNATHITISNVLIDHGAPTDDEIDWRYLNTDGLHFKGPLQYVTIDNLRCRTADDCLAFNANDYNVDDLTIDDPHGPYVRQGPITDVSVQNVQVMGALHVVRILSSTERIDRVTVSNVSGTVSNWIMGVSHWMIPTNFGNIGSIDVSNVYVNRSYPDSKLTCILADHVRGRSADPDKEMRDFCKELNGGEFPLFSINAHVERLSLRNVITSVVNDRRPIIRIGPDARIRELRAELHVDDEFLHTAPIELNEGGHIDDLRLELTWKGRVADQGKNPIRDLGGTIGKLQWINTPPMYVGAESPDPQTVVVYFNQAVKSVDYRRGVHIRINGTVIPIESAVRLDDTKVQYGIKSPIDDAQSITWAYDAAEGFIENLSGDALRSVAEKTVTKARVAGGFSG